MTKEFNEILNKDKNQLSVDELMIVFKLWTIKKNENSILTDIILLASPLIIALGIINIFIPIFVSKFAIALNYIATIPAFINIAIKIREITIKKKFMKQYDVSRKEMSEILKSDQMKVFNELVNDLQNNQFEVISYEKAENTIENFDFAEQELAVDLTAAKQRVERKHQKTLVKKIIKKEKTEKAIIPNDENGTQKELN